ncbi:MAG TPA: hypothetical protein PKX44_07155 [Methanomassiliicoccaceae archaeon]|jgi:hypothetical protein|nr:hypothetical protein [Methanomassiliicoccaceae archaeon]
MKMDQVYVCEGCGLELKVVKECKECGTEERTEACECPQGCTFDCCGGPMQLRS